MMHNSLSTFMNTLSLETRKSVSLLPMPHRMAPLSQLIRVASGGLGLGFSSDLVNLIIPDEAGF